MNHLFVEANGLRFHALAAGPSSGPLVLLLHGFPEYSRSWRHQLPALARAGYRAVAPDLRGFAQTDKRGPYDLATLVEDLAALVRALGRDRAAVVGHDWGGAIAWMAAHRRPEVVERLAVLNAPHPAAIAREIVRNPRQLARSAYVLAFLIPRLPERLLTARRAWAVAAILRAGARVKSAWAPEELERYRQAFLEPGAARSALGYYRALAGHEPRITATSSALSVPRSSLEKRLRDARCRRSLGGQRPSGVASRYAIPSARARLREQLSRAGRLPRWRWHPRSCSRFGC